MDKYTYTIKTDKIQKLVKSGDYVTAAKVADTIEWEEVHSVRILVVTAAAYEQIKKYKEAIELLEMAYEESAVGKRILYKLTGLAIADGNVELAQRYYDMYLQEAPDENGRYLLRYLLAELKGESLDKRIAILETYRKFEQEEEWTLRLAQLYDEAGMSDQCVKLCDEIILWFGVGSCVDEAMKLKEKYAPLSEAQQEHRENKEFYEQRYREVVRECTEKASAGVSEEEISEPAAPVRRLASDFPWADQIRLIEAPTLQQAIGPALEMLSEYSQTNHRPMCKLTRIAAERFNMMSFKDALPHIAGKDLLIDSAASLSDERLEDIVQQVKKENWTQVFILADNPNRLAFVDARLGDILSREEAEALPEIEFTAAQEQSENEAAVQGMTEEPETAATYDTAEEEPQISAENPDETEAAEIKNDDNPSVEEDSAAEMTAPEETKEEPKADALLSEAYEAEQLSFDFPEKSSAPEEEPPAEEAEEAAPVKAEEENPAEDSFDFEEEEPTKLPAEEAEEAAPVGAEEESPAENPFDFSEAEGPAKLPAEEAQEAAPVGAEEESPAAGAFDFEEEEPTKLSAEEAEEENPAADPLDFYMEEEPAEFSAAEAETEEGEIDDELEKEISIVLEASDDMERVLAEQVESKIAETEETQASVQQEDMLKTTGHFRTERLQAGNGMTEDDFVEYAKNYLQSIDCTLFEDAEDALRTAAALIAGEGKTLTKELAEELIENAADKAEKRSGLFSKRYDKAGCLILRARHFL